MGSDFIFWPNPCDPIYQPPESPSGERGSAMAALPDVCLQEQAREALLAPWRERPLEDLVEHILTRYHRKLERDLRVLLDLIESSQDRRVHVGLATFLELQRTLLTLADELLEHMTKEEQVLFPWILGGNGRSAGAPIAVMQQDHRRAATLLASLRNLTQGYRSPPGECSTWCRLVFGLRELAQDLEEHLLLEDLVLFPRALSST